MRVLQESNKETNNVRKLRGDFKKLHMLELEIFQNTLQEYCPYTIK
jgi:hypothetical protein